MPQLYANELAAATQAVTQAAALCRAVQAQIDDAVLEKSDKSPVTVADFGSQALICQTLAQAFPNDPVIAEEAADELRLPQNAHLLTQVADHAAALNPLANQETVCQWIDRGAHAQYADRFWTLDPIDGTKGFLRKDQYAVALALIVDGQLAVAALACPNLIDPATGQRGQVFTAVQGQGAYVIPLDDPQATPTPIHVTKTIDSAAAKFCESVESGHSAHDVSANIAATLGITQEPFRIDSQCKYAALAAGWADIYLRLPTRADYQEKIWDHAAGALVVQEAGGTVTDTRGLPLDFTLGQTLANNKGVIVTNGHLHSSTIAAVALALT